MVTSVQANNASLAKQNGPRDPLGPSSGVREAWVKLVTGGGVDRSDMSRRRRMSGCWKFGPDLQTLGTPCFDTSVVCHWNRSRSSGTQLLLLQLLLSLLAPFLVGRRRFTPQTLTVLLRRPPLEVWIRDFDCRACWLVGWFLLFIVGRLVVSHFVTFSAPK